MKKKSFLRDDDSGKKHLKIVISDPDAEDMVLVVSVCTIRHTYHHDESCMLDLGDHPWISCPSYINYRYCNELDQIKILNEKFRRTIILKEDISDELLQRIQHGARQTKFLAEKFKKYFHYF